MLLLSNPLGMIQFVIIDNTEGGISTFEWSHQILAFGHTLNSFQLEVKVLKCTKRHYHVSNWYAMICV